MKFLFVVKVLHFDEVYPNSVSEQNIWAESIDDAITHVRCFENFKEADRVISCSLRDSNLEIYAQNQFCA